MERLSKKRIPVFEAIFLAVTISVAIVCLRPVLAHSGWPWYPEHIRQISRTVVYAEHLKQGDLFPVWSADDAYGMGTPLPLFYHKTFNYLSSVLLLILGSVKAALSISLGILMLAGAYGLRFCLQKFTKHKLLLLLTPQTLLLAHYTTNDWLLRGATAEFSAMMLFPWLLWWCLCLLRDKRFSYAIIPIMLLIVGAHNIMSLFAAILPATAYIIYWQRSEKTAPKKPSLAAGWRQFHKRAIISSFIILVLLTPGLLIQKAFLRSYNLGKITQDGFRASENYISPLHYLFNIKYWLWLPLAIWLLSTVLFLLRGRKTRLRLQGPAGWSSTNLFLLIITSLYIIFQLPVSGAMYRQLGFLQFLQFPWRLVAFVVPLFIVATVIHIVKFGKHDGGSSARLVNIFVASWFTLAFLFSPAFMYGPREFRPEKEFNYLSNPDYESKRLGYWLLASGEYTPKVFKDGRELSGAETLQLYADISHQDRKLEVLSGGPCQAGEQSNNQPEALVRIFEIKCSEGALVALPVSYNDFTLIREMANNRPVSYYRYIPNDPRLVIEVAKTEGIKLEVKLPNAARVLKQLL